MATVVPPEPLPSPAPRYRAATLVERDAQLAMLHDGLRAAWAGSGRIVFIGGEAGIGKTALVETFQEAAAAAGARVVAGFCDGVSTPRPLAPLYDMAAALGPEFAAVVEEDLPAHRRSDALLAGIAQGDAPTVLVIEDLHWADEATVDLVRYLGRRVGRVGALVVTTSRDDAGRDLTGLRAMIADLATLPTTERISLHPLSEEGVAAMAAGTRFRPSELHRLTGGNPFFVAEVLSAGVATVPSTVADSTRARIEALDARARDALDAAAVLGNRIETWLLAAVAGEQLPGIDDCLRAGILIKISEGVAFRHELTRLTVMEDLPVFREIGLHRRALDALRRAGSRDDARLAYHAEGAADATAVLVHSIPAARVAMRVGAYREAVAQLRRAQRFAEHASDAADVADLLDRLAYALFLINEQQEAFDTRRAALARWRRLGDVQRMGDELRWLSRLAWILGDGKEARDLARQAYETLEPIGECHELALACSNLGHVAMLAQDGDTAIAWSERALAMAERIHDPETIAHALNNLGAVQLQRGDLDGIEKLRRSAEIAIERGYPEHLDRALYNLTASAISRHDPRAAAGYLDELIAYTRRSELERCSLDAIGAHIRLERGEWVEAERLATRAITDRRTDPPDRCTALDVLTKLEIRRGGERQAALVAEAEVLAARLGDLQNRGPVVAARAEAAWLRGASDDVADDLQSTFAEATEARDPWLSGDLGRWLWRTGLLSEVHPVMAEPYALQIAGDWAGAAAAWDRLGVPFEAALARLDADDPAAVRDGLRSLDALGAAGTRAIAVARLRALGAAVPQGPRAHTRAHPHGLTQREEEIAELVAAGLSNREIAEQLVLSEKTVGHHVSAVLGKLDVRRRSAVGAALRGERANAADAAVIEFGEGGVQR